MALHHRTGFVAAALLAASFAAGPAKAVVTVAPYQAYLNKECGDGATCSLDFPKVPAPYRVVLNHASCYIQGDQDFIPDYVQLIVYTPQGQVPAAPLLTVNLTGVSISPVYRSYSASADASAFAVAGNHFEIQAGKLGGNFMKLDCNIDGNVFKLN